MDRQSKHATAWLLRLAARWSDGIRVCVEHGAASGRMMEYACENKESGRGALGRWIDRRFLNYSGWEGVRQRRDCLEKFIKHAIDTATAARPTEMIYILDLAAGTAEYLLNALLHHNSKAVAAICLDNSNESIERGRNRARQLKLSSIRYERGDADDAARVVGPFPHLDIVICSGFYELLQHDRAVASSIAMVADLLRDDGWFIVCQQTAQPWIAHVITRFRHARRTPRLTMRSEDEIGSILAAKGFAVEQIASVAKLYVIFLARRVRKK